MREEPSSPTKPLEGNNYGYNESVNFVAKKMVVKFQPLGKTDPILEGHHYLIESVTHSGETVDPKEIFNLLKKGKHNPTIIGGHAFNVLARTKRSTVDVDILVDNPEKAAVDVLKAHPEWKLYDGSHAHQQRIVNDQGEEVVDLLAYDGSRSWGAVKTARQSIGGYSVPKATQFIVNKFLSSVSSTRDARGRIRDRSDYETLLVDMAELPQAQRIQARKTMMRAIQDSAPDGDYDSSVKFGEMLDQMGIK